jgi:uncharacterized protein involved in exopolysaccharide biosynthesis
MRSPHVIWFSLAIAALIVGGGVLLIKLHAVHEAKVRGRFKATTRFTIQEFHLPELPGSGPSGVFELLRQESHIKGIASRENLRRVVKRLKLDQAWGVTPYQAAESLEGQIDVALEAGTEVVTVTAWGNNRLGVAHLANAVREVFKERLIEERFRRMVQYVDAQIDRQTEVVDKARLQMLELQRKYKIVDLPSRAAMPDAAEVSPVVVGEAAVNARQHLAEFNAARQGYDSQLNLLSTLRDAAARAQIDFGSLGLGHVDLGVVQNPIKVVEIALPPKP